MGVRLESLPEILEPLLVSNTELSKWGGGDETKSDLVSKNQDFVYLCLCISLSSDSN